MACQPFSPAVIQALANKKLSGDRRNELTRDVCSSIRVHTLYPTKAEREHVAFLLVKKYPFLADTIGTGIGSWETAFKYRSKNLRKTGKKGEARSRDKNEDVPAKKKRRFMEEYHSIPEGETEETMKEHIKAMKKEMACSSNRNMALIKDLMTLTYPYRKQALTKEVVPVSNIIEQYPALTTSYGIKAEFGRILGKQNPVKEMSEVFQQTWVKKVLDYGVSQPGLACGILSMMEDAITATPSKKSGIEEAAAVVMLPRLLKEKGGSPEDVVKICTEEDSFDKAIEESRFPRLVGSGEFWCLDPLCVAVEGAEVLTLGAGTSLANALGLVMACFFVFNISYPAKASNLFCETLLGKHQAAKKRVAVNKCVSTLL